MASVNNIESLRKARGWSRPELARRMRTSTSQVERLEKGHRSLKQDWIDRAAAAFDVAPAAIITPLDEGSEASLLLETASPVVAVPILGSVPAGNWREAVYDQRGWEYVAADFAKDGLYALRVDGDSMDRIVPDCGTIIIDPSDRDVFHGHLFVVRDDEGNVTFKRYLDSPGRLEPCSKNPEHKTISITDREYEIVGRILKIIIDAI